MQPVVSSKVCQYAMWICDNFPLTVGMKISRCTNLHGFNTRATSYIAYLTNMTYPMMLPNTYQSTIASYVAITFNLLSSCYNQILVKINQSKFS